MTEETNELLPCPWCGKKPTTAWFEDKFFTVALRLWNTRHQPTVKETPELVERVVSAIKYEADYCRDEYGGQYVDNWDELVTLAIKAINEAANGN